MKAGEMQSGSMNSPTSYRYAVMRNNTECKHGLRAYLVKQPCVGTRLAALHTVLGVPTISTALPR